MTLFIPPPGCLYHLPALPYSSYFRRRACSDIRGRAESCPHRVGGRDRALRGRRGQKRLRCFFYTTSCCLYHLPALPYSSYFRRRACYDLRGRAEYKNLFLCSFVSKNVLLSLKTGTVVNDLNVLFFFIRYTSPSGEVRDLVFIQTEVFIVQGSTILDAPVTVTRSA